jgi:hypothetical protein
MGENSPILVALVTGEHNFFKPDHLKMNFSV